MADEYYTNTTETGEPSDSGDTSIVNPVDEEAVDPTGQGQYQQSVESGSGNEVRTFTEQPVPPYSVGDIWLQEDGDYSCVVAKPIVISGTSVLVEEYTGGLYSVVIDGKCTQDGEPTPTTPVPITYLTGTLAIAVDGTTAFAIDIAANRLCSLPSGVTDTISIDADGVVTVTKRIGFTTTAATDGITGTVGIDILSSTGEIADGVDVYYELPVYETTDLGTVTMATVASGDTITAVPETNITVGYGAFAQTDWVPNFVSEEVIEMVTKPTTQTSVITDFSAEALEELSESGAVAVGQYATGSAEIPWEHVEPPIPQSVVVIDEALDAAKATNQHFWHDDNGAHVATVTTTGDALTTLYGTQIEIEAVSAVPLKSLTIYGASEQVGIPSATSPIPINSVEGTNGNLSLVIDHGSTTTVSIPVGNEKLCGLPNNVRDTISIDETGAVTLTKNVGYTNQATTDGITATVGVDALSSTGTLADGADVYYALQTPVVSTLSSITMPTVSDGNLLAVDHVLTPELAASWVSGTEPVGDGDTGYNSLWNSLGMFFRNAANWLVSITRSAIAFYDGQGNAQANVVASFGANGAQIGKDAEEHLYLSSSGMELFNGSVSVANFGNTNARIGATNTGNLYMTNTGISIRSGTTAQARFTLNQNISTFPNQDTGASPAITGVASLDGGSSEYFAINGKVALGSNSLYAYPGRAFSRVPFEGWDEIRFRRFPVSGTDTTTTLRVMYYGDKSDGTIVDRYQSWSLPILKTVANGNGDNYYGHCIQLGGGGLTIVGGGEFANNFYNAGYYLPNEEYLILGADSDVIVCSNGNTVANRKEWNFGSDGRLDAPGNIVVTKDSGNTGFNAWRSDAGTEVWFGIGAGGTNHGVYSEKQGRWLLYGDATNVFVGGINMTDTPTTSSFQNRNTTNTSAVQGTMAKWGKMCQISAGFTLKNAVSVPANGNVTNLDLGTLSAGNRPVVQTTWLDYANGFYGTISTGGVITIQRCDSRNAAYTIAAGTSVSVNVSFILP